MTKDIENIMRILEGANIAVTKKPENDIRKVKVYLAGGFASKWQTAVKKIVPCVTWLDPSVVVPASKEEFTKRDLRMIDEADVVFAYLENTNPGGYNLAMELGYAYSKKKEIVFVCEKYDAMEYIDMLKVIADAFETNLFEGLLALMEIISSYQDKPVVFKQFWKNYISR